MSNLYYSGMTAESREASFQAAKAAVETAEITRAKVYQFIRGRGACGATDDEVQRGLNMGGNTQRPRRVELWMQGLVTKAGITRVTPGGRKATVWVAA